MKTYEFSKTLVLRSDRKFNGSVTVEGDLLGEGTLEVFGDLTVTGKVSVDNIKVHGNLSCCVLDVCCCFCDGDIHILSYATATDIVCKGTFTIESECVVDSLTVESNAHLHNFKGESISAQEISCHSLTFSSNLNSCGNVTCEDEIVPMSPDVNIYVHGVIRAQNMNIG